MKADGKEWPQIRSGYCRETEQWWGDADKKVGQWSELVTGSCTGIRCIQLFWASEGSVRWGDVTELRALTLLILTLTLPCLSAVTKLAKLQFVNSLTYFHLLQYFRNDYTQLVYLCVLCDLWLTWCMESYDRKFGEWNTIHTIWFRFWPDISSDIWKNPVPARFPKWHPIHP